MMAAVLPTLITELDAAVKTGSPERSDRILQQVMALFLSNVDRLGEAQIGVLDDVLVRLVGPAESASLAQLSETLSKIDLAPRETVRKLAWHDDPTVAAPVLRNSNRLSEKDLIEIVGKLSQQHLLAVCERKTLSEALTDAILRRADASVSNALAQNPGAAFSDGGYTALVGRAERDESLTEKLGLRLDLPAVLLRQILTVATDVVRAKFLTASRPVEKPGAPAPKPKPRQDYSKVTDLVSELGRTGKLNNSAVNRFAAHGDYLSVMAALAFKADVKVEVIEPFLHSDRLYALVVTCKAARLDWTVTRMIIHNRPNCPPATRQEFEQAREIFEGLILSIAQWTVRFASERM